MIGMSKYSRRHNYYGPTMLDMGDQNTFVYLYKLRKVVAHVGLPDAVKFAAKPNAPAWKECRPTEKVGFTKSQTLSLLKCLGSEWPR